MTKLLVANLHNGVYFPVVGLGTWQLANDGTTTEVAKAALSMGYLHIDTADCYKNQPALGVACSEWKPSMREASSSQEPIVPHSSYKSISADEFKSNFALPHGTEENKSREFFVTGKIFTPDFTSDEQMEASVDRFKSQIGRDADLMLLHWPGSHTAWMKDCDLKDPGNPQERLRVWRKMESLYHSKRLRAIGISNYMLCHLEPLIQDILERRKNGDETATIPMMNQIEFSPLVPVDPELEKFMEKHHIMRTSYSTQGSTGIATVILPEVQSVSKAISQPMSSVCLRWAMQKGYCVIPRTSKAPHAKENFQVTCFQLTEEQMKTIDQAKNGEDKRREERGEQVMAAYRVCPDPYAIA